MTCLIEETRKDAGKHDTIMSKLFDSYMLEQDISKLLRFEKVIETNLIQMSGNVNHECYQVYEDIYKSMKDVRREYRG